MESIYYIGLDVHKKSIAYCIKTVTGKIVCQGMVNTGNLSKSGMIHNLRLIAAIDSFIE